MTRTTPELAPPLQTSTPHQWEDIWPLRMIYRGTGPIHGGSSVESGFDPGALRTQSRDLTHRLPWPGVFREKGKGKNVFHDLLAEFNALPKTFPPIKNPSSITELMTNGFKVYAIRLNLMERDAFVMRIIYSNTL
ncbi:hypothetical protein AVEN_29769-1 [Araneus ventricosus]|uniref:Uncharacterized protein n=1 Tax=Araneus ventricosus TaxID=182803 RepID=A0A4Y2RVM4_ARAVE|nr:hypothetical protein AVEN_29769-1 [Araneus ventricosus]